MKYLMLFLLVTVTLLGILTSIDHTPFTVENFRGQTLKLYGSGIYHNETLLHAAVKIGTDIGMLIVVLPLLLVALITHKIYLQTGMTATVVYYSANQLFGTYYNDIFLLYLLLLSSSLYVMYNLIRIISHYPIAFTNGFPRKATAIFLLLAGLSLGVWLIEIVGSIHNGQPPVSLGNLSTEPTYAIDLAIIAPLALICAYHMFLSNSKGIWLAIVLIQMNATIAAIIICQTVTQVILGTEMTGIAVFFYTLPFIIMGTVGILLLRIITHKSRKEII